MPTFIMATDRTGRSSKLFRPFASEGTHDLSWFWTRCSAQVRPAASGWRLRASWRCAACTSSWPCATSPPASRPRRPSRRRSPAREWTCWSWTSAPWLQWGDSPPSSSLWTFPSTFSCTNEQFLLLHTVPQEITKKLKWRRPEFGRCFGSVWLTWCTFRQQQRWSDDEVLQAFLWRPGIAFRH